MSSVIKYLIVGLWVSASVAALADTQVPVESADGKVLVVLLFDVKCKTWCSETRPRMRELQQIFGDKIAVAELDTTQSVLKETEKKAKELGILGKIADSIDYVPDVLIFDERRKLAKELTGPKETGVYQKVIEKLLSRNK
jgi:hypothetical protein